jgi:hypothetical protein
MVGAPVGVTTSTADAVATLARSTVAAAANHNGCTRGLDREYSREHHGTHPVRRNLHARNYTRACINSVECCKERLESPYVQAATTPPRPLLGTRARTMATIQPNTGVVPMSSSVARLTASLKYQHALPEPKLPTAGRPRRARARPSAIGYRRRRQEGREPKETIPKSTPRIGAIRWH